MSSFLELADRCEKASKPSRLLDFEIQVLIDDRYWPIYDWKWRITNPNARMSDYLAEYRSIIDDDDQDFDFPRYTSSLDGSRSIGGMLVFASDIGADGLALVCLVTDTGTSPIKEYVGIAATLELAWCAAALRVKAAS
jgi:hypothetical protein